MSCGRSARSAATLQTAIFALEQLYPFPEEELLAALRQYKTVREVVWVQEEPANMGAMLFLMPRLRRLAKPRSVLSVKLSASPSPATGSGKGHEVQQKTLLSLAFTQPKGGIISYAHRHPSYITKIIACCPTTGSATKSLMENCL